MTIKFQVAGTYKRKVDIEFPGDGFEPQKGHIIAILNDVDPDELESDEEKLQAVIQMLLKWITAVKSGNPAEEAFGDDAEEMIKQLDVTPKIDRILAGVELPKGVEIFNKNGEHMSAEELLAFAKKYPRFRVPILKKHKDENESGEGGALGNLLKSAAR